MTGDAPDRYRRRPYVHEEINGIDHHWVWASGRIHTSRGRRVANYMSFATNSAIRGLVLPTPSVIWASSPPVFVGTVGSLLARRFRRPWIFEIRDLWPESAASVGWLAPSSPIYARALQNGSGIPRCGLRESCRPRVSSKALAGTAPAR